MSRARTKASSASSRLPRVVSVSDGNPIFLVRQDKTFLHPQVLPSSHTPHLTCRHMLLALPQGTCSPACYHAVQASIASPLITALAPAGLPPVPSALLPHGGQSGPSQVSVSSHPSSAHSLRGCLSLQQPPKSFPRAPLFPLLTSGLASTSPRLRHGGLLATQEHALRATAWGPRPHCAEHAAPRCPVDQRPPSLTTR